MNKPASQNLKGKAVPVEKKLKRKGYTHVPLNSSGDYITFNDFEYDCDYVPLWRDAIKPYYDTKLDNNRYYKLGQVPLDLIDTLENRLELYPRISFSANACKGGFVANNIIPMDEKGLHDFFEYYYFGKHELGIVKNIIENLQDEIEDYFSANFRVLSVRGSITKPNSRNIGPNNTHRDGSFPLGMCKMLIYLTELSKETGSTFLKVSEDKSAIKAPRGTYILFNPIITRHRGVPPEEGYLKKMIEVTLCPWKETIIEPEFGGPNGRHPIEP